MSESLVIRLDAAAGGTASWVAVDDTGALLGTIGSGALAQAAAAAGARQVVVLVPAVDVLRARASVPLRSGPRLLQALPFALEDQLAEDVDSLHFAAGSRSDDGSLGVAVVRHATMADWLARLATAGIRPARLCSAADAVASMPNTATVMLEGDTASLTLPDGTSATVDTGAVPVLLELWAAGPADQEGEHEPLHLVAYGSEDSLATLGPALEALRPRLASLELRSLVEGPLPRLAAHIATSPGINLLQGGFAQRSSLRAYWPAWRLAAIFLLALVLVMTAVQLAGTYRTRQQLARINATVDQAFHHVFPDAGPVADARAELSARLQQIGARGSGANHEFLDMLRVVAQSLGGTGNAHIEALSYRAGTLELRLRAPSVEFLDRIQQQVSQTGGLQARIQSANASGNEVIGHLQITHGGG